MSAFTTFANGLSVAGAATLHVARSTQPDECKDDDGKYPNYIFTTELGTNQTVMTFIQGGAIWTESGILDKTKSLPAHAGKGGGVNNGGIYQGVAEAVGHADDVYAEGKLVVCMTHTTWQNDRNTVGEVDDADNVAAWLAEHEAANAQTADAREIVDDGAPEDDEGKTTEGKEGDDVTDEQEEEPPTNVDPDLCDITEATITCEHNRSASGGRLQVVAAPGDTITCVATMTPDPCPDKQGDHPVWVAGGSKKPPGKTAEVRIGQGIRAVLGQITPGVILALPAYQPQRTVIQVEGCQASAAVTQFTVEAWPSNAAELSWTIGGKVKPVTDLLLNALAKLSSRLKGEVESKAGIEASAQWKENSDWRVYCGVEVKIGFVPLIGVKVTLPIPAPPPVQAVLSAINWLLAFVGGEIRFSLIVSLALSVTGNFEWKIGIGESSGSAVGELAGAIGFEAFAETGGFKAVSSLTAGASGSVTLSRSGGDSPRLVATGSYTVGKLTGAFSIEADVGWVPRFAMPRFISDRVNADEKFQYKKSVTVFDGFSGSSDPIPVFG